MKSLQKRRMPAFVYRNITFLVAVFLFIVFFGLGSALFTNFFSLQVFCNLLIDNSYLLIAAIGSTMVVIIGGIDLSVGAVIAFCNMALTYMLSIMKMPIIPAIMIVLCIGSLFGMLHGWLVTFKGFQPFIATLAGQFIARGACYLITVDTIFVDNPLIVKIAIFKFRFFGSFISIGAALALVMIIVFQIVADNTQFGRNVYAVGGNEQSANLMGLPVRRTKFLTYTLSGFLSAVASLAFMLYVLSATGTHGDGLHLDAVASAVIGGALTSGGVGLIAGTLFGVLTQGTIRTMITFQGTLSSWWAKIATAFLLLLFILIQRAIVTNRERSRVAKKVEVIDPVPAAETQGVG
ncbi:MAG: sugar ABC transporter permease YjfF [Spirochaetales bacterium]|jgi:simple sugar transport system permease protein|nr:sugar ABC transporter permease YjfF [Spirochaetales bacterium]